MSTQTAIANALLNPERPCPEGLVSWNQSDPAVRFAVYRNNVTVSLINALADTFPVVEALVGPEFFRAMARHFVQHYPPQSRQLTFYGSNFPDFVAGFPPAASVPYLADVGRLELARIRAYHAADRQAVPFATLQSALLRADAGSLQIALHPSLHSVSSPFAVTSIWIAHQGMAEGTERPEFATEPGESAWIFRDGLQVEVCPVPANWCEFARQLASGHTVAEAVHRASAEQTLDLPLALATLIRHQLITAIGEPEGASADAR